MLLVTSDPDQLRRIDDENKSLIQAIYSGLRSQQTDLLMSSLDPDITVYEPTFLRYGGVYRGIDAFAALFPQIDTLLDLSTVKVDSIIAEGEQLVCLVRVQTADAKSELRIAEYFVIRSGKIVEIRLFFHDLYGVPIQTSRPLQN